MASGSRVYIAGTGSSPFGDLPQHDVVRSLISAATKALLDAGVTYDDVTQGLGSIHNGASSKAFEVFDAFEKGGIPVDELQNGLELDQAFDQINKHHAQCVLVIAAKKSVSVALTLVSETFLWRHPYLKDSAVLLATQDTTRKEGKDQGKNDFQHVCQIVWTLRGWTKSRDTSSRKGKVQYTAQSSREFTLSRADGNSIPEWTQVEHRQDGKHRLGYNPALETRDVHQEDFDAVRSSQQAHVVGEFRSQFHRKGGDRAALAKL